MASPWIKRCDWRSRANRANRTPSYVPTRDDIPPLWTGAKISRKATSPQITTRLPGIKMQDNYANSFQDIVT